MDVMGSSLLTVAVNWVSRHLETETGLSIMSCVDRQTTAVGAWSQCSWEGECFEAWSARGYWTPWRPASSQHTRSVDRRAWRPGLCRRGLQFVPLLFMSDTHNTLYRSFHRQIRTSHMNIHSCDRQYSREQFW